MGALPGDKHWGDNKKSGYVCRSLSGIFPDGGSTPPASTNKKLNNKIVERYRADRILAFVPEIVPFRSAFFFSLPTPLLEGRAVLQCP